MKDSTRKLLQAFQDRKATITEYKITNRSRIAALQNEARINYGTKEIVSWLYESEAPKGKPEKGCTCDQLPEFDMDGSGFSGCCRFCLEEQEVLQAQWDAMTIDEQRGSMEAAYEQYARGKN